MSTQTKELWTIDPAHSEIQFKVKHMVISTVSGNFTSYDAKIESEGDDFEDADIAFKADINSIATNNEDRDNHLKSDDFFDAEKFPELKFESTSFEKVADGEYNVKGNMTIRDQTKEIALNALHGGTAVDPQGNTKAGFEIKGAINRKDFGLTWNPVTETGNVVVGEEVKLQMDIQLAKN